jgi:hypothetical protein
MNADPRSAFRLSPLREPPPVPGQVGLVGILSAIQFIGSAFPILFLLLAGDLTAGNWINLEQFKR